MDSPATWLQLAQWDPFIKLAPAVVSTLLLMLVMARFKSPLALPAVLVFLPGIFFVVLACLHKSLVDAQDGGWVAKPAVGLCCLQLKCVYCMYLFEKQNQHRGLLCKVWLASRACSVKAARGKGRGGQIWGGRYLFLYQAHHLLSSLHML